MNYPINCSFIIKYEQDVTLVTFNCCADVAVHRPADIRPVLESYKGRDIATEFIERSKEHQR